jgi:hypothetical protein
MKAYTPDPARWFDSFLSLGHGSSVLVTAERMPFLKSVSVELEKLELYETVFRLFDKELNESNVLDRLKHLEGLGCSCESEIELVASRFYRFSEKDLSELSVPALSQILSHRALRLKSKVSLYCIILSTLSHDPFGNSLLEYLDSNIFRNPV